MNIEPRDPTVSPSIGEFIQNQLGAKGITLDPKRETKAPEQKPEEVKAPVEEPKVPASTQTAADKTVVPEKDAKADDDGLSDFAKSILGEDADPKKDETEKKADDSTEEDDELSKLTLPDNASQNAKDSFKKVNVERARLKRELAAVKKEKEELASKVTIPDEIQAKITTLEKELKAHQDKYQDAESKLFALDIKQTEQWKKVVTEPLSKVVSQANALAEKYHIKPADLRKALAIENTNPLSELLQEAGVNNLDTNKIASLREDMQSVLTLQEALEADSREAHKVLTEAQQRQQLAIEQERASRFAEGRDKTAEKIKRAVPFAFRKIDGDAEWNEAVESFEGVVKSADPSKMRAESLGQALAMGATTPLLVMTINRLTSELKAAHARVQKLSKAAPTSGPRQVSTPANTKVEGIGDFVKSFLSQKGM